ncbi:hypothetical protein A7E78_08850 [Syntrophotalea acetylenivorans]|uniref:histidine kinase n=1 Tax=Syntrophotalea acetylenivorans TaxID=1842532 RepID=A0A1L3GPW1_9BACT|nr:ATP-binding protein [Syntrophotalea acetylenivorans]APG27933.1 hypothetical protein A7E78_08850 [Syntrophotalea acetylenivorans]
MPKLPSNIDVNDLYYRLFSHLPDCLVVIDRQHRVVLSNWRGGFEDVPVDKREGMPPCAAIFHPDDDIPFNTCPATEVFRSGRTTNREFHTSPIGTFECRAFPIFDQTGDEVIYVALQISNVSERKELEKQLTLCQRMETVSCMAAGLVHDFNNLLTVVGGFGRILHQAQTEPNLQQAAQAILDAEQRARALLDRLMMIGEGHHDQAVELNLNNLIGDLERLLRSMLEPKVELDIQLDPALTSIHGKADELEQVILNLAINGRDAMTHGGRLTISTANQLLPWGIDSTGSILPPGPYVVLTVTDTGHGMDETTREKIFEPFFTNQKSHKGTGLGMTVVFSIVKRHLGHISVASSPDGGTTFEIYLPHNDKNPPADL